MPQSLTSPSVTILSAVAVCRENRPSRLRSRDLVDSTIMPSHSLSPCSTSRPSAITGSIGLMRGNPSLRRVASIINPVAASRLSASAASSGASPENSVQVAMGAPYGRDMTRFVDRLGRSPRSRGHLGRDAPDQRRLRRPVGRGGGGLDRRAAAAAFGRRRRLRGRGCRLCSRRGSGSVGACERPRRRSPPGGCGPAPGGGRGGQRSDRLRGRRRGCAVRATRLGRAGVGQRGRAPPGRPAGGGGPARRAARPRRPARPRRERASNALPAPRDRHRSARPRGAARRGPGPLVRRVAPWPGRRRPAVRLARGPAPGRARRRGGPQLRRRAHDPARRCRPPDRPPPPHVGGGRAGTPSRGRRSGGRPAAARPGRSRLRGAPHRRVPDGGADPARRCPAAGVIGDRLSSDGSWCAVGRRATSPASRTRAATGAVRATLVRMQDDSAGAETGETGAETGETGAETGETGAETGAWAAALGLAFERATDYLAGLGERPVGAQASVGELRASLDVPLPDGPVDATDVVRDLADAADPGVVATGSPRYFGFVIGGALPAAVAADWLAAAWDQNAGLYVGGPSAAVAEEVAGGWVLDLLGLPPAASFGFVTGGQTANTTALAAARHGVLARAGWDVERRGLAGAPPIRVLAGDLRHATIDRALRLLGLGAEAIEVVPAGADARMRVDALADRLAAGDGPTIVCAQAGEVNSGAIDRLDEICDVAHAAAGAWVHVDGAFGLWAGASPEARPALSGVERADSWATDFHKWLNVPYDSGFVACADRDAHRGAMGTQADYLVYADA